MAVGRRFPPNLPSMKALSEDPGKHLYELWKYIRDSVSGLSAPHAETHLPDSASDPLTVDTPVALGEALSEGTEDSFARSDHVHALSTRVAKAGSTIGTRKRVNFIDGANVSVTVADDSAADEVDVTVAATGLAANDAEYIVAAAHAGLTAERVATNTATVTWDFGTAAQAKANVPDDAITDAKLRESGALSVIGRSANSTGNPADISATPASDAVLRESGSVLGFGTVATAGITNAAVTYAKIQDVSAASRLLGRGSAAGSGDVEEITLGDGLTMSSTTLTSKRRTVMLGSDVSNNTASIADATGLSFSVAANTNYQFEFYVVFQTSSTSHGIRLALNGPSSPTQIVYDTQTFTAGSAASQHFFIVYDGGGLGGTSTVPTADSDTSAFIRGILRNGANAGTLIVRFVKVGIGGSATIKTGSMGWINEVS